MRCVTFSFVQSQVHVFRFLVLLFLFPFLCTVLCFCFCSCFALLSGVLPRGRVLAPVPLHDGFLRFFVRDICALSGSCEAAAFD